MKQSTSIIIGTLLLCILIIGISALVNTPYTTDTTQDDNTLTTVNPTHLDVVTEATDAKLDVVVEEADDTSESSEPLESEPSEEESIAQSEETYLTPDVEYHTADEILTLYHLLALDQSVEIAYAVEPDMDGLTTSGALTDAVQINALNTLNFTRYIAGLSYNVILSQEHIQYAQDGATALAAIGDGVDHYFDQPSWMSDSFYESASIGTANSNLSAGRDNLSANIVHGWLSDEGEDNRNILGHRRAILAPVMEATGFGFAYATTGIYRYYSSMSVIDIQLDNTLGVMWPAQTMPVEYFANNYPWSFSPGSPVSTNTEVTITRANDGATWYMKDDFIMGSTGDGYITINNDYYAQPGCIIFTPDNITYSAGDIYHVEINYTTTDHFTMKYTVEFISLSDEYEPQTQVTVVSLQ